MRPEVHHADAIGDVMHDGEVVRDEQIGEPELALQVAHQVQHLRLHRHVERGRRLVADEERAGWSTARGRSRSAAAGRPRTGADTWRRRRPRGRPASSSAATRVVDRAASRSAGRCARIGSATMSATRQRGLRLAYGSWKIICMPRARGALRARRRRRRRRARRRRTRSSRASARTSRRSAAQPSTCRSPIRRPAPASRPWRSTRLDAVDRLQDLRAACARARRSSHGGETSK